MLTTTCFTMNGNIYTTKPYENVKSKKKKILFFMHFPKSRETKEKEEEKTKIRENYLHSIV